MRIKNVGSCTRSIVRLTIYNVNRSPCLDGVHHRSDVGLYAGGMPGSPIDPDVDLHDPEERAELRPSPVPVLSAISAGGVVGALTRYGISTTWPRHAAGFPWATWSINVTGSFLIGVLMTLIARFWPHHRLIRPFFGVGMLGGYTTFSTSVVDVQQAV